MGSPLAPLQVAGIGPTHGGVLISRGEELESGSRGPLALGGWWCSCSAGEEMHMETMSTL